MCVCPNADSLIEKTSAMEAAEFELKASVEFVTDAIRASKIQDCSYNSNCGACYSLMCLSLSAWIAMETRS